MPFVRRTRATLRSAEFGFFGVWVNTRTHTPRFCGLLCSAGLFVLLRTFSRPCRTSWLIVGIVTSKTVLTQNFNSERTAERCPGIAAHVALGASQALEPCGSVLETSPYC